MEYGITAPRKVRSEFFGDQIEGDSEILQKVSKLRLAGPFLIGKQLGSGITGSVRLGTHVETGFKVALKIIKKKYLNKGLERWSTLRREIAVMKITEHPNIVKLYDVFETPEKIYLVTELLTGGELFQYIPCEGLSRSESLRMLAQMTSALLHCHEYGIVHRDLKPENLLMDESHNIKLGDFGMARLMKDGAMLNTSCGSPHYASPEVIDAKYDGKRSDVWSLGVILYAMIVGKLPFDHKNIPTLLMIVKRGEYEIPSSLDDDIKDLITSMIQVDVSKRIRMEDILFHRAFRKGDFPSPLIPTRGISSSPSRSPSRVLTRTLEDGDLIDRQIGPPFLDDSLLEDLISLGWKSKEELYAKILQPEPSQEKSLYKHLERRRRSRIAELQRLSPRRRYSPLALSDSQQRSKPLELPLAGVVKDGDVDMSASASAARSDTKRTSSVLSSPYSPSTFPKHSFHSAKPPASPSQLASLRQQDSSSSRASEVSLRLFSLANSTRGFPTESTVKRVPLKRPSSARILFPESQGDNISKRIVSSGIGDEQNQRPESPSSTPDRLSLTDSPKTNLHPLRLPPKSEEPSAPPGPTSIFSRWFSDFFRRRPSFDPWHESLGSSSKQAPHPSPSSTTSSSYFFSSSSPCPPSPCPPSPSSSTFSSISSSPSPSPSTTTRSLLSPISPLPSLSRERSSSLPIDILSSRGAARAISSSKKQQSQYSPEFSLYSRQLPKKKEPKPSKRASSAYVPKKEFYEETETD